MAAGDSPERVLHERLERWARDHAGRYPEFEVVEYDPAAHPEQRLETAKTPTSLRLGEVPWSELEPLLRRRYRTFLGLSELDVIAALEAGGATAGGVNLVGEIRELLRSGASVAVLAAHADRLEDIGTLCGALAVALGDVELIRRNGAIVNKVMTREGVKGAPVTALFDLFANVYWVIPESESSARWGIPQDVMRHVNAAALRAIVSDMQRGILLTFAPSGTAMRRTVDRSGALQSLGIPRVTSGTAKLLARFDAYVATSFWEGRLAVGELTRVVSTPKAARAERTAHEADVAEGAIAQLAALTERLAGVRVEYLAA